MVSSTLGSLIITGENRLAKAASFSTYLRYSSVVVAPHMANFPLAKAGFKRFDASIDPSAFPNPISKWNSSTNKMTFPAFSSTSFKISFNLPSKSPRNFDPEINPAKSIVIICLSFMESGTSPLTIRWASPSITAVLPVPAFPISTGLFLTEESCWL
ncbi:uncharacterized protein SPAPADRAFT_55357 [Spathaspora passalidarum NRRL Y-27907]|uniref:Uncharacterized protein n=1 Tax=Spathaspora passalidarum (strain NRRL Y-27907 / 11-Y1) TaxID=619300 RepID=G3AMN9_SPAPN|nr:uncharacterized protein SPAPADRAFT_55357 [Spathaspora passalidarum NRRL Y-27907]EGW33483.1 hypothetical protein SPAPADRAFT_55357 [Spathaspora passalidarum NRRL Y-27907]